MVNETEKKGSIDKKEEQSADVSSLFLLMMLPLIFIIVLDPEMRTAIGNAMDGICYPSIGFDGKMPIWTLFMGGVILVFFTTIIRHKFTDWESMGKSRHLQRWYQDEIKKARENGDLPRMKKLLQMQSDIMKMTMSTTNKMMRSMVFTMVIAILIFFWLAVFISEETATRYVSVPWSPLVDLTAPGPFLGIMPTWILLYILLTIPIGQLIQSILKIISFSRKVGVEI